MKAKEKKVLVLWSERGFVFQLHVYIDDIDWFRVCSNNSDYGISVISWEGLIYRFSQGKSHNGTETETPSLALGIDQLKAWINRKLVSQEVRKLLFNAVKKSWRPGWRCVSSPKVICKQRKWFYFERLLRLEARFHDFVGVDLFATVIYQFFGVIEVRGHRSWPWNINFGTGTLPGRNKQLLKTNRGVGIIVAQNNQSSQTSIPVKRRWRANSNENAKMQANHSTNQNRKAAEVLLLVKGIESKLRPGVRTSYQNSSNNKSCKIWKPIES